MAKRVLTAASKEHLFNCMDVGMSFVQAVRECRARGLLERTPAGALEPLTDADMDTVFNTGSFIGPEQAPLREIIKALQETYCGTIGVEYMYVSNRAEKRWIQEQVEGAALLVRGQDRYGHFVPEKRLGTPMSPR